VWPVKPSDENPALWSFKEARKRVRKGYKDPSGESAADKVRRSRLERDIRRRAPKKQS
jgi:hypothetical protein